MKRFVFACCLLAVFAVQAQIPDPIPNTHVNDFAKVLQTDQVSALDARVSEIENSSNVQVAIVLVNALPAGYTIKSFAASIGKTWHVGTNQRGIVYVAAITQHKQRLEIATNLQGILTTTVCADILDAVKPSFKAGDYNAGLDQLLSKMSTVLPVATAQASTASPGGQPNAGNQAPKDDPNSSGNFYVGLFFVIGVIVLIVYLIRRSRRRAYYGNFSQPGYGGPGYNNGPGFGNPGYNNGPGVGGVVAGAVVGAAAAYAAGELLDDLANNNAPGNFGGNGPYNNYDNSNNNQSSGGDNWDNSSSSDDSGFSDDSSSSDSGASSDW